MRLNVRGKIWGIVALFVVSLIGLSALDILSVRDSLLAEKKLKTRHLVESAHAVAAHFALQSRNGELAENDARAAAIRALVP